MVDFFLAIRDQYINQQQMGKPICTYRLEGVEAALRLFVPPRDRRWIVAPTLTLFRLVRGLEAVNWVRETGHVLGEVPPEVFHGDKDRQPTDSG